MYKMKNIKYIRLALLSLPLVMASCMNDDFDTPSANGYSAYSGDPVNTTIAALKSTYSDVITNNKVTLIKPGTIIEGTVISNDEAGNFYQTLVIQDATGGIQINVAGKGQHIAYPLGQKVVVKCDSLFIGGYGKAAQMGVDYYNATKKYHAVGRMSQSKASAVLIPDGMASASNLPTPKEITKYSDLKVWDTNSLVTLKNVSFDDSPYKTFAPEAEQDGGYAVDRNISFADGTYIVVRTSSYANFANKVLPGGTGDLTGVMGYYNGTYQFVLRDYTKDVSSSFTQVDKVRVPLYSETIATSLGQMTSKSVTTTSITDKADWTYSSSYNCAVISAYDKTTKKNSAVISYLVSPTIDLSNVKNAFVSFESAINYANAANLAYMHQLLISSDYAGDPAKATWTVIPFNAQSKGFTFFKTGKVAIPAAFIGKKITLALRYKSTTDFASTWEVKNFMVDEGEGSTYTLPELQIYQSSLVNTDGGFKAYSETGDEAWDLTDSHGLKMTAFVNKKNMPNIDWAVSPEISLAGADAPVMSFDHAINYGKGVTLADYHTLWITDNFTGDVTTTKWTQITIPTYPAGTNWTYANSGDINFPEAYQGKKIRIAFKYESTSKFATTWEIKNLSIK
jgi:hypothetical protein